MGSKCLFVTRVRGFNRLPVPPASTTPFIASPSKISRLFPFLLKKVEILDLVKHSGIVGQSALVVPCAVLIHPRCDGASPVHDQVELNLVKSVACMRLLAAISGFEIVRHAKKHWNPGG